MEALQRQKQMQKNPKKLEDDTTPIISGTSSPQGLTSRTSVPGTSVRRSSDAALVATVSPSPSTTEKQLTALATSNNWIEAIRRLAPDVSLPESSLLQEGASGGDTNVVSDASTGASSEDGNLSDSAPITSAPIGRKAKTAKNVLRKRRIVEPSSMGSALMTAPIESPRKKYQRKDEELWRATCQSSPRLTHTTLPTFDEAVLLFGFATSKVEIA